MRIISMTLTVLLLSGMAMTTPSQGQQRNIFADPQNLQVLPADISPGELSSIMRGFTSSLGRRCAQCHMGEEDMSIFDYDFASDERPLKLVAREMLKMVMNINQTISGIDRGPDYEAITVTCITCHRGTNKPVMIESIMDDEIATGGGDAAAAKYRELREAFFGGFAYDFSAVAMARYADNLSAAGNGEAAIKLHLMNVEFNPSVPRVYFSMGNTYEREGMLALAIATYRKLLEVDPSLALRLEPGIAELEEQLAAQ